jgi:hypothetical protein
VVAPPRLALGWKEESGYSERSVSIVFGCRAGKRVERKAEIPLVFLRVVGVDMELSSLFHPVM